MTQILTSPSVQPPVVNSYPPLTCGLFLATAARLLNVCRLGVRIKASKKEKAIADNRSRAAPIINYSCTSALQTLSDMLEDWGVEGKECKTPVSLNIIYRVEQRKLHSQVE